MCFIATNPSLQENYYNFMESNYHRNFNSYQFQFFLHSEAGNRRMYTKDDTGPQTMFINCLISVLYDLDIEKVLFHSFEEYACMHLTENRSFVI